MMAKKVRRVVMRLKLMMIRKRLLSLLRKILQSPIKWITALLKMRLFQRKRRMTKNARQALKIRMPEMDTDIEPDAEPVENNSSS